MEALQFNVTVPRFIAAKGLRAVFGNGVFYRGPAKTISPVDIPEPSLIDDDWVKLRTIYCGFCGSDLNLMLLHDSPTASPFTSFPCVPGHEIVAEVIEPGSKVEGFKKGDIVVVNPFLGCEVRRISPPCRSCQSGRLCNCENTAKGTLGPGMFLGINSSVSGGFAPRLVAHKSQLHEVPSTVSLEAAVMIEPLAVAIQAVFDNYPSPGDKILIIGGGVIGNLIIQSVKALVPDCHISAIEPSAFASSLALDVGADQIIPHGDVFRDSATITSGTSYKPMLGMEILMGGFNRIYDTVGNSSTLNLAMRILAAFGTLSVVGIGGETKLDLTPLWLKLQNVKGVYGYGIVEYQGEKRHVFDIGLELIQQGKIEAEKLVTHRFELKNYSDLIRVNLAKGKHKAVKTVMMFK